MKNNSAFAKLQLILQMGIHGVRISHKQRNYEFEFLSLHPQTMTKVH